MIAKIFSAIHISMLLSVLATSLVGQAGLAQQEDDSDSCHGNSFQYSHNSDFGNKTNLYNCPSSEKNYLTTPLLPEYFEENVGRGLFWNSLPLDEENEHRPPAVVYLSAWELKDFSPVIKDGKFRDGYNRPWNTGPYGQIFVMDEIGRFFIKPQNDKRDLYHSGLSGGLPVAAAGIIVIEDGAIISLSDQSGHYQPQRKHINQAVARLKELGLTFSSKFIFCPISPL